MVVIFLSHKGVYNAISVCYNVGIRAGRKTQVLADGGASPRFFGGN